MRPDAASTAGGGRGAPALRLVPRPKLRVLDVALFYGERSGGIRTYLDAKRAWVAQSGAYEHRIVTPHDVPAFRFATPNGYRVPLGVGALLEAMHETRPDVVLLHDPFWAPLGVTSTAHALGGRVVAVHHGSVDLDAAGLPVPGPLARPVLRRWFRHAYRDVDAVMSAVPTRRDTGRRATLDLRFGLDPAFRPRPEVERGDHVLYVGRLAREKGVLELLGAAALAREPWPLRFVGSGPVRPVLAERARRLGIAERVSFAPYVSDRDALARTYAGARAVVMPGAFETFGLVGFEAAASGARVVVCRTAPSRAVIGDLAHAYAPGDVRGLARAIEAARATPADPAAAQALHERSTWPAALEAEHRALADLVA